MRYRAFLSYSHADAAWARWLLRRLETYRVPSRLVGTHGANGVIERRLGTFFRDREELPTAGDLGETIRAALADSETLVVICSPTAAQSRWVNAEVAAFQTSGRGDRVLCFVVGGVPGSADPTQHCFPPALLQPDAGGAPREPLAADARREGDGRERAFLKLVAGLLGVGYDALAQREAQRRQRKWTAIAGASLAGMAIALALAATAYVARNDAQRRQAQAEDILGFMLGDLRKKLTTVGRLDLMRVVDDKATTYFATLDPRDLSDRALEEQARSLTGIGEVRLNEGKHDAAMAAFREAHARSTALYQRDPENGQRLFDLAQAEYWIGFVALEQGRHDETGTWFRRYRDSAIKLAAMDRNNFDWQKEVAYGHHNLAVLDERLGRYAEAERAMQAKRALYVDWLQRRPKDLELRFEDADDVSWLGSLAVRQGKLDTASGLFQQEVDAMHGLVQAEPRNPRWKQEEIEARLLLAESLAYRGRLTEASAHLGVTTPLSDALVRQDPANNGWRVSSGVSHFWQAQVAAATAQAGAEAQAVRAAAILSKARATEPKNERVLRWLAKTRGLQALLAQEHGDAAAAQAYLSEALALLDPAWQANPNEALRLVLANNRMLAGEAAQAVGERDVARANWRQAEQLLTAESGGDLPFERLDPLVRTLYHLDRAPEAYPHRQRLAAAGYVPLRPFPATQQVANQ
ncbi:toll/interleukin-1 receptor domain-containing protein [Aerolutibacter daejeonensis]|uniref:toll/interleukin-1 receptor domain-containing protein n=1 Tax=Aerolutibacter daejeonensis TaxID=346181 RepID=UPI0006926030|nr:toll/interleukin-1 receptor domain-containing protein [Lysobacter daejeonensis]